MGVTALGVTALGVTTWGWHPAWAADSCWIAPISFVGSPSERERERACEKHYSTFDRALAALRIQLELYISVEFACH